MSYNATVFTVMIASPSDVKEEHQIIRKLLDEWNAANSEDKGIVLVPIECESHTYPKIGKHPQEIINQQVLAKADLLVAVFWTRIGTATKEAMSGTVEEIKKHVSSGKPAMLYFSSAEAKPDSFDLQQMQSLREFKEGLQEKGYIVTCSDTADFERKLHRHLAQIVNNDEYFKRSARANSGENEGELITRAAPSLQEQLSEEAKSLLVEASHDPHRTVLKTYTRGGLHIQTNGKQLVEPGDPRTQASWEGALEELCDRMLLKEESDELFTVTREGYEVADTLANG